MEPPLAKHTLRKEERLYRREDIAALVSRGRYGAGGQPIRYCLRLGTGEPLNRILVSVPKKNFKRAVKRNLLKRRIRESYRLQKQLLPSCGGADIMFVYSSKEVLSSEEIFALVGNILREAASKMQ